jgi:5-methyltetrahydrofolate--homocysteine methyltransferase
MVHVASRDGAPGFRHSLLIRRRHDLEGAYGGEDRSQLSPGQTVYVTDASRAVGVASSLLSKDYGGSYAADIAPNMRRSHAHASQRAAASG